MTTAATKATPTIYTALAAVMDDVQSVSKKDRNSAQGFNFRGIDAVVNAVGPALRKHGVIVTPCVVTYQYGSVEVGKARTPMGHAQVTVTYTFHGPAGDSIQATVVGEAMDSGDKATAKAMSVAFRTALLQALALPTDEPDPDASSYERSPAKPKATPEQLADWLAVITAADSVDTLSKVGAEAGAHDMPDAQRTTLRAAYVARKGELDGGASHE